MSINNNEFLCRKMRELREENALTMEDMARRLNEKDASVISNIESGKLDYSALIKSAKKYCATFKMDKVQTEQFLRAGKIVILDTSALLHNPQIIKELSEEYSTVVIPDIVIDELTNIKDKKKQPSLRRQAWQILQSISSDPKIVQCDYAGDRDRKNDYKIIHIARDVYAKFGCEVDIITNDIDFSAYLKGQNGIKPLHVKDYLATKQDPVDMMRIEELDKYYALSYDDIQQPTEREANAYFNNGNTLIISTIKNRSHTLPERKAKVKWLIDHGADIDKQDRNRHYLPPISHAVQKGDYDMFLFLLKDCHANPNVGSRNPHRAEKLRQTNEGNMPLMIAAWEGKDLFVKTLCEDPRTSINQQDSNGFTALIKACANKYLKCRDILLDHGADERIVDINGKTYKDHLDDADKLGPLRNRGRARCR